MSAFDEYVQEQVVPVVERLGWWVEGSRQLTYTVGRTARGLPELAVTGKPPDAAADLIEAVLVGEEQPASGSRCDLLTGPALCVATVAQPRRLRVAWHLYGPRVRAVQLVWADSLGRWPWDVPRTRQELLGALGLPRAS
jgi:hypothetical protein